MRLKKQIMPEKTRFTHSIKFDFLVRAAVLVMIAVSIIVSYNYFSSKNAAIESAKLNIQRLNSLFIMSAAEFMHNARTVPENAALLFYKSDLSETDLTPIRNYLFNLLAASPLNTSVMFSLNNGYFFSLDEIYDAKNKKATDNVEDARYVLHIIDERTPSTKVERKIYYDQYKKFLTEIKSETPSFNFREFKWYLRALESKQTAWSNVHLLHRNDMPGITISTPIKKDDKEQIIGVLAVDTLVKEFSTFINEMRFTDNTSAYIIDNNRKIIANSNLDETYMVKNNNVSLLSAEDVNDPVLKAALNTWSSDVNEKEQNTTGQIFTFSNEGISYIACVTSFPKKIGLYWRLFSITPITVFTDLSLNIQKNSLFLAMAILIIALSVAYFQAQKFSEPITELAIEAYRIKDFDLEESSFPKTNLIEINQLSEAMEDMKVSLNNFGKYIPKALTKQFLTSGKDVHLGGETQELCIFFSDVADFTNLAEGLKPADLMLHLSEYFEELSKIILFEKGTIDKFIGDSIMAFWGAPVKDDQNAYNACRSALLCQQKLRTLNKFWHSVKRPPLVTRMGIHLGRAVVGNVGSSERMNYTAIGDSVNLASRLEGLNKHYGTTLIISEAVRLRLPETFITRPLDTVAVKGKKDSTKIYELIGAEKDDRLHPPSAQAIMFAHRFGQGVDLYINQQFKDAHAHFMQLEQDNQKEYHFEDKMTAVYLKRCEEFILTPPPADWDGVTHFSSK